MRELAWVVWITFAGFGLWMAAWQLWDFWKAGKR